MTDVLTFPAGAFPTAAAATTWLAQARDGDHGPMTSVLYGLGSWPDGYLTWPMTPWHTLDVPTAVLVVGVDELDDAWAAISTAQDPARPGTLMGEYDAYGMGPDVNALNAHLYAGILYVLDLDLATAQHAAGLAAATTRLLGWAEAARAALPAAKQRRDVARTLGHIEDTLTDYATAYAAAVTRWVATARVDALNDATRDVVVTDSPATRRGANPAGQPRLGY